MRFHAISALAALLCANPATPEGLWLTEDHRGVIEIAPCGDNLCGRIVGMGRFRPDGSSWQDVHGTPECHLTIMPAMALGADHLWHGTIYDPTDGSTYTAQFGLDGPDRLALRGYLGIPLLGKTQTWTRYTGQVTPDCHFSQAAPS